MKKLSIILLLVISALSLCACGSIYDREYVVVEDYEIVQAPAANSESVTVSRYGQLRDSILQFVMSGTEHSTIVLDASYNGSPAEDLASACWELRSQNALCAYAVENIAYELSQIVTYYEADIYISYADIGIDIKDISHLSFAYELRELIENAMKNSQEKIAALVESAYYNANTVSALVRDAYYSNPELAFGMPKANIVLYSGMGQQKLYEIDIDYGTDLASLTRYKERLAQLSPFEQVNLSAMSDGELALAACEYLVENCALAEDGADSVYDALLNHSADSAGLSLAYVKLCSELGLNCRVISGQKNWQDHVWNIVSVDGENYHVDISACLEDGIRAGFLHNDSAVWGSYRWDIAAYPKCAGSLSFDDISEKIS